MEIILEYISNKLFWAQFGHREGLQNFPPKSVAHRAWALRIGQFSAQFALYCAMTVIFGFSLMDDVFNDLNGDQECK